LIENRQDGPSLVLLNVGMKLQEEIIPSTLYPELFVTLIVFT
jgi:hypothetical protein